MLLHPVPLSRENNPMTDPVIEKSNSPSARDVIPWRELVVAWRDAALLVVLSTVAALAFNFLRSDGLPLLRYAPFDLLGPCPEIADEIPRISPDKLRPGDPNLIIVDVRLAWDFLEGHLPGAWFLPMYETAPLDEAVVARLREAKPGTRIVLTGAAGTATAERALTALSGQGLRGLHVLEGGVEAWVARKRPLEVLTIPMLVKEVAKSGNIYIDARDDEAFEDGHRDGAIHLPFDDLLPPDPETLARLQEVKGHPLVVYAGTPVPPRLGGARPVHPAYGVAAELVARGFRNVSILGEPYLGRTRGSDPEEVPSTEGTPVEGAPGGAP